MTRKITTFCGVTYSTDLGNTSNLNFGKKNYKTTRRHVDLFNRNYYQYAIITDYRYFQLNQPTRCSKFFSLLLDVYLRLNMFRASSCPSSGAKTTAVAASGLPSELGDSSAVGRGRTGLPDHDQQHCYHHATKVKPETATAVVVAPDDGRDDAQNMLTCT